MYVPIHFGKKRVGKKIWPTFLKLIWSPRWQISSSAAVENQQNARFHFLKLAGGEPRIFK
jgi:hypothetical protein